MKNAGLLGILLGYDNAVWLLRFLQEPHGIIISKKTAYFIVIIVKTPNLTLTAMFCGPC
jgi:hypothetical protein